MYGYFSKESFSLFEADLVNRGSVLHSTPWFNEISNGKYIHSKYVQMQKGFAFDIMLHCRSGWYHPTRFGGPEFLIATILELNSDRSEPTVQHHLILDVQEKHPSAIGVILPYRSLNLTIGQNPRNEPKDLDLDYLDIKPYDGNKFDIPEQYGFRSDGLADELWAKNANIRPVTEIIVRLYVIGEGYLPTSSDRVFEEFHLRCIDPEQYRDAWDVVAEEMASYPVSRLKRPGKDFVERFECNGVHSRYCRRMRELVAKRRAYGAGSEGDQDLSATGQEASDIGCFRPPRIYKNLTNTMGSEVNESQANGHESDKDDIESGAEAGYEAEDELDGEDGGCPLN